MVQALSPESRVVLEQVRVVLPERQVLIHGRVLTVQQVLDIPDGLRGQRFLPHLHNVKVQQRFIVVIVPGQRVQDVPEERGPRPPRRYHHTANGLSACGWRVVRQRLLIGKGKSGELCVQKLPLLRQHLCDSFPRTHSCLRGFPLFDRVEVGQELMFPGRPFRGSGNIIWIRRRAFSVLVRGQVTRTTGVKTIVGCGGCAVREQEEDADNTDQEEPDKV